MRLLSLSSRILCILALAVAVVNAVWLTLRCCWELSSVTSSFIQPVILSSNAAASNAQENSTIFQSDAPLAPLRVYERYKRYHSHESLLGEDPADWNERQFIIGYYSCPLQAGNRLHDFWNSLIVAILTNRTLLWKFMDRETCLATNHGYDPKVCTHNYTERDCSTSSLQRAEWIPSFDDWAPRLGLNQTMQPRNPDYKIGGFMAAFWGPTTETMEKLKSEGRRRKSMSELEKHPSRPNWLKGRLIQTSREMLMDEQIPRYGMRNKILYSLDDVTLEMVETFEDLYSEGVDFLYGMLYRDTFAYLGEPELMGTSQHIAMSDENAITIAIHSRHTGDNDDGELAKYEQRCLDRVFEQTRRQRGYQAPCYIFIMSDRQLTINQTSELATETYNCTPIVAAGKKGSVGLTKEHGVFAGNGFFQDLFYGTKARDGYIGHAARSSSQMLQEGIIYDSRMEALRTGTEPRKLAFCSLPSGYGINWQLLAGK